MSAPSGNPLSSNKISLALLKGRSAAQSVPSMSFRFNSALDNITQINEDDTPHSVSEAALEPAAAETDGLKSDTAEPLPKTLIPTPSSTSSGQGSTPVTSTSGSSMWTVRSSSLDSESVPASPRTEIPIFSPDGNVTTSSISTTPSTSFTSGSFFSRFSKTFEHKIHEFRNEKLNKDKSYSVEECPQASILVNTGSSTFYSESSSDVEQPSTISERKRSSESITPGKQTSLSLSNSPSRKTSLAQDLAELSTELGNRIPKLSELRNRKSGSKESRSSSSFKLNSLLGRDEGMLLDDYVTEEGGGLIEAGVEAEEGISLFNSSDNISVSYSPTPQPPNVSEGNLSNPLSSDASTNEIGEINVSQSVSQADTRHSSTVNVESYYFMECRKFVKQVVERAENSFRWSRVLVGVFLVCFVLPVPRFLAGAIFGAFVSCFFCYLFIKIFVPELSGSRDRSHELKALRQQRPVLLDLLSDGGAPQYKGWLNKLDGDYSPENYHVYLTHSVFVRLHGSKLLIDHPRRKISKHCRYGEDLQCGGFVHHREYDLKGATVILMPRNLPRRWLWSRKYPICIKLQSSTTSIKNNGITPTEPISPTTVPGSSRVDTPFEDACAVPDAEVIIPSDNSIVKNSECLECNEFRNESNASNVIEDGDDYDSDSFEEVTQEMCTEKTLYFFARADREKDDWFRRFVDAAEQPYVDPNKMAPCDSETELVSDDQEQQSEGRRSSLDLVQSSELADESINFSAYMAQLLYPGVSARPEVAWINAMAGRLLYDFLRNPYWENKIQERVQRKLSKVHVPHIVGELIVCGVQLGGSVPQLRSVGVPRQDNRGLWCDLEVEYQGNFTMTIETKLDLMKLKKSDAVAFKRGTTTKAESLHLSNSPKEGISRGQSSSPGVHYTRSSSSSDLLRRDVHFDTDTDDSVESSSEDDGIGEEDLGGLDANTQPGGSRKVMKLVDRVASNRYFQQVTDWKPLQKAMKGVSNTRIVLSVTVEKLVGTLAINIPPQPSDRLWYGFRTPPELVMPAQPKLGDRKLNLPFLTDFIQKKLYVLFEKVFVLPNMDDLVVPIMSPLMPGQTNVPRPPWVQGQGSSVDSKDVHPPDNQSTATTPAGEEPCSSASEREIKV